MNIWQDNICGVCKFYKNEHCNIFLKESENFPTYPENGACEGWVLSEAIEDARINEIENTLLNTL